LPRRDKGTLRTEPSRNKGDNVGFGVLYLSSEPWAEVSIDGEDVGTHTPLLGLRLRAGSHEIRLHNPHYKIQKTIRLRVPKGGEVRQFVDLTK
jgi:hypothetical protein